MEFIHCPYCTKFVAVTTSLWGVMQKTMCKKCFKVFYVWIDEKGMKIYKEEEVIVNRSNNTVILKSTIKEHMQPKVKKLKRKIHALNKKITEEAEKEKLKHAN